MLSCTWKKRNWRNIWDMKVEYSGEDRVDIQLKNGNGIIILHSESSDELTISFTGKGQRNLKRMQNRIDGYSGVTFTKQEDN